MSAWENWLEEHRQELVDALCEALAIPSVSTLPDPAHRKAMRDAAAWWADRLKRAGMDEVQVWETPGHPAVFARWDGAPGAPTVLFYGHYDVQPPDPEDEWDTPPFSPTVVGNRVVARGASDDKGPVMVQVAVLTAMRATGELPVNVRVLIEGEEEISSAHLPALVAERAEELRADVLVVTDTTMAAPGVPTLCTGLRGLCALEVTVQGPRTDVHSGLFGGAVANPIHALARMLAGLHDDRGRVTVPGFYDGVRLPTPAERAALEALPPVDEAWMREMDLPSLVGEEGFSTLERVGFRPTLEVNGIVGGYTGPGQKTIIPARASAKITCRLVPDQDPVAVRDAVARALRESCPPGVRVRVDTFEAEPGMRIDVEHPALQAMAAAMAEVYGRPPAFMRMGGSIPVIPTLVRNLGVTPVLLALAEDQDRFHAPGEHWDLSHLDYGARAIGRFLLRLARLSR